MILSTASLKASVGTAPVAAITNLKSVDIQWGLMPLRPFRDQLGVYTNLGIYSLTFSATKGSNTDLDKLADGSKINVQYLKGSETYSFKGTVASRKTLKKEIANVETELTVITVLPDDDCTVAPQA